MASEVQSVAFDRSIWSVEAAHAWLTRHGIRAMKVDPAANWWRFRLTDPRRYTRFRAEKVGNGIMLTYGFRR